MNEATAQNNEKTPAEMARVLTGLPGGTSSPPPPRAPSLVASQQPVSSIESHFTKSTSRLAEDRSATEELIKKIEKEIADDMTKFADLANRVNVRTAQLNELRSHQLRLQMAVAMAAGRVTSGV